MFRKVKLGVCLKKIHAAVLSCSLITTLLIPIAQPVKAKAAGSAATDQSEIIRLDMSDGTVKDSSVNNIVPTLIGNVTVGYDDSIGRNVFIADGTSCINFALSDLQKSQLANAFTVETVFKLNTAGDKDIVSCGGFGIESDSSSNVSGVLHTSAADYSCASSPSAGLYHYEAVTYDGSCLKIYLDGVLQNTVPVGGTVDASSIYSACIGGKPDASGITDIYTGEIAYVDISGAEKDAAAIASSYTSMKSALDAQSTKTTPKVGVISDVHLTRDDVDDTVRETKVYNALTYYKNEGINLLVVNGDIADTSSPEGYAKFNRIFSEVFTDPGTAPQTIYTMGNHDYFASWASNQEETPQTVEQLQQRFMTCMNVPGINTHKIIGGYHFIGLSTEDGAYAGTFTDKSKTWLTRQLEAAKNDDPAKPVFIFVHQPVKGTVPSSGGDSDALDAVLRNYPQAVVISGHTHTSLVDEKAIYQKNYTCINDGCMYYVDMDNWDRPADAFNVANSLLITVDPDRVHVQRYDVQHNEVIKNDWLLDNPFNGASSLALYSDARAADRSAPYFDTGTAVTATDVTPYTCNINFGAAHDADFVSSYSVAVTDAATGSKVSNPTKYSPMYSDYYKGLPYMAANVTIAVSNLIPGRTYNVSVTANESFGKSSSPITGVITTPLDPSAVSDDVLRADFTSGSANDGSAYNTKFEFKGNAKIIRDDSIGKYVLNCDGNGSYLNYYMTNAQIAKLVDSFSIETLFKINAKTSGAQGIMENMEAGGIGFEYANDSKNTVNASARFGNSYQAIGAPITLGQYHYMVYTYDGSQLTLYLDGNKVSSKAMTGSVAYNNAVAMCFGANPSPKGAANNYANINIAYGNVTGRVLSGDTVKLNYDAMFGESAPDSGSIVTITPSLCGLSDDSAYDTAIDVKRSARVAKDTVINKYVLVGTGLSSSYANIELSDEQYDRVTHAFTLESVFEVRSDTKQYTQAVLECLRDSGGIGFTYNKNGNIDAEARIGGVTNTLSAPITYDVYHHLTLTYNGDSLTLYLDGKPVASKAVSGDVDYNKDVALCIGGRPRTDGTANSNLNGRVAYVNLSSMAYDMTTVADRYTYRFSDICNVGEVQGVAAFNAENLMASQDSDLTSYDFYWMSGRNSGKKYFIQIAPKEFWCGDTSVFPYLNSLESESAAGARGFGASVRCAGISGLTPGDEYVYRVSCDGVNWSRIVSLRVPTVSATFLADVVKSGDTAVTGKAQPGNSIEVFDVNGNPLGSGTADSGGSFSAKIPSQCSGAQLVAISTDNLSGSSSAPLAISVTDAGSLTVPAPSQENPSEIANPKTDDVPPIYAVEYIGILGSSLAIIAAVRRFRGRHAHKGK